jgi:hypothetical protein
MANHRPVNPNNLPWFPFYTAAWIGSRAVLKMSMAEPIAIGAGFTDSGCLAVGTVGVCGAVFNTGTGKPVHYKSVTPLDYRSY